MKCKLSFYLKKKCFQRVDQDTAVLGKFPTTRLQDCIRGPQLQLREEPSTKLQHVQLRQLLTSYKLLFLLPF